MSIDLAIVGAGLSGGLLAYRIKEMRPSLRILILEGGEQAGGNHTWSFHQSDLRRDEAGWLEPFVEHRWPAYEVRFPARRRRIDGGYRSISSTRFRSVLAERLGPCLREGLPVSAVEPKRVVLADRSVVEAEAVIDARGPREMAQLSLGYQKFLGQEVKFERPHGLREPIVMDATVRQEGGYRFVYCLPFSDTRMLIEDTYYADGPEMKREDLRERLAEYASDAGWGSFTVCREEDGVLPIALGGDIEAHLSSLGEMPTIGLGAALFHPTTGYSLPDAVRTADLVAGLPDLSARGLAEALKVHIRRTWGERSYFRMLNRLLFKAGEASERYRVLEHFHRLPEPVIARFYAARLSPLDKLRILAGRPPVSVAAALRVLAKGSR